ncbi:hypothetical protein NXY07_00690 [Phocaeicola dorei]|nr:hypothetical protein [Phocaeicola dorei]
MPEWFTYAKARVSFAQVGNDLDPHISYITYMVLDLILMKQEVRCVCDKVKPYLR